MNFFHEPVVSSISVETLKKALDAKEKFILLDVRTIDEFQRGHIAQSVHIPLDQLPSSITKIASNKSEKIYVYCLSGSRSSVAVDWLTRQGYTNTCEVSHGLLAWRAKYYPLIP